MKGSKKEKERKIVESEKERDREVWGGSLSGDRSYLEERERERERERARKKERKKERSREREWQKREI